MTDHISLAPDGAACRVLSRLYYMNGSATPDELLTALLQMARSKPTLQRMAIDPLVKRKLITIGKRTIQITPAGRALVESLPMQARIPAPAPTVRPGEFSAAKFYANISGREGAFDYLEHPSLMGDERVPYRTNVNGTKR